MPDVIAPLKSVTFTITRVPRRDAERKTIQRLMRMQPRIQAGLKRLARNRRRGGNRAYIRAGVEWVDRRPATKLTRVAKGESFTLHVTPQILPDIRSVEAYLSAAKA